MTSPVERIVGAITDQGDKFTGSVEALGDQFEKLVQEQVGLLQEKGLKQWSLRERVDWLFDKLQRRRGNASQLVVIFEAIERMGLFPGFSLPIHLWIVYVELDHDTEREKVISVIKGYRGDGKDPDAGFFEENSRSLKQKHKKGRDIVFPVQAVPEPMRTELFGPDDTLKEGKMHPDALLYKCFRSKKVGTGNTWPDGPNPKWPDLGDGFCYLISLNHVRKGCGQIKFDKGVCEATDRQLREAETNAVNLFKHEGDITWVHPEFKVDKYDSAKKSFEETFAFLVHNCALFWKNTIWWKGFLLSEPDSNWHEGHIEIWEEAKKDWDAGPWQLNFPGYDFLHPVVGGIWRRYQLDGKFKGMWSILLDEKDQPVPVSDSWIESTLGIKLDERHTVTDRWGVNKKLTGHMIVMLLKNALMNHMSECFSAMAMTQLLHHAARVGDPAAAVERIDVPGFPTRPFYAWQGNLPRSEVLKTRFGGMIWRNRDPALRYRLMARILEAADANYFWEAIWKKWQDRSLTQRDVDTLNESNFMDWGTPDYRKAFFDLICEWAEEVWWEQQVTDFEAETIRPATNIGSLGARKGPKYQVFLKAKQNLLARIMGSYLTLEGIVMAALRGAVPGMDKLMDIARGENLYDCDLKEECGLVYDHIGEKTPDSAIKLVRSVVRPRMKNLILDLIDSSRTVPPGLWRAARIVSGVDWDPDNITDDQLCLHLALSLAAHEVGSKNAVALKRRVAGFIGDTGRDLLDKVRP